MKKTIITIVMTMLCLIFRVQGQFYDPSEKTLSIGDTLPQAFYQQLHSAVNIRTQQPEKLNLAAYKDKLIIFDFWATWCKPCISSLNDLDSIQAKLKNTGLVIVPITYQTEKEVAIISKKFNWNMLSIVNDTTFAQIFPTGSLPHQVWIKNSKVIAIPEPGTVTATQIEKVLLGEPYPGKMKLVGKKYQGLKPMFTSGNLGNGESILFQSSFTGYRPDLIQQKAVISFTPGASTIYVHNIEFTRLYYEAFKNEIFAAFNKQNKAAIVLEISSALKKRIEKSFTTEKDKALKDSLLTLWKQKNWYCYNLFSTLPIPEKQARQQMQNDVNQFFGLHLGIHGQMENRIHTFAILSRLEPKQQVEEKLKSRHTTWERTEDVQGNFKSQNDYFDALTALVLSKVTPYQILDETGIDKMMKVDFTLPKSIRDNLPLANKALSRYGLKLLVEERSVPVLVIRQAQASTPTTTE
jgi:thiol-disulfide isomerase/thioredoxin